MLTKMVLGQETIQVTPINIEVGRAYKLTLSVDSIILIAAETKPMSLRGIDGIS